MGLWNRIVQKLSRQSFKMVQERGNGFYAWNGRLYHSDVVRACIRPKTKAIGKAVAKHIRTTRTQEGERVEVNPDAYIRFLLEEPNPLMSGQMLQEKVANQLALNHNAFILIVRDEFEKPIELYPIPCSGAEAFYKDNELFLRFVFLNGRESTFPYSDIIHLRDDFNEDDIFGESPMEALSQLMECVSIMDQGFVKAIKNSGVIRWLLRFTNAMRPDDVRKNVQEFADTYLSVESETFGAAGVDSKADVQRIEPKDYVPNAAQTDRIIKRIYDFFNTNEKIVSSLYTEDEWIAYYESAIEPMITQMSAVYSSRLFTRRERAFGNKIVFECSNLTFASMRTKLELVQYVDRGIMTPNEVRAVLNMAPVDGGDRLLRRKDTGFMEGGEEE